MVAVTSTQLQALKLEEVSGVESPANLLEGFMVYKGRTPNVQAALEKALDAAVDSVFTSLTDTLKANPSQPRSARTGQFRQAIPGIDSPATPPSPPDVPAAGEPSIADKALGLFRPAQGYRRIW